METILWIVYVVFAVSVLYNIFNQLPFIMALAWVYPAVAGPLKFIEVIDWSWWWIILPPIAVAVLYGRMVGSAMKND